MAARTCTMCRFSNNASVPQRQRMVSSAATVYRKPARRVRCNAEDAAKVGVNTFCELNNAPCSACAPLRWP